MCQFGIFPDHLVDDMAAVKIIFLCVFHLIITEALYLSSTPVKLPDDYNEANALPLAVAVEDNEARSKEDDFNDILKTNFYLKHLLNKPEVEELKSEESIEVSSNHDEKSRIVVKDNANKTIEIKEDIMDIIIFPDSDIIIPPKGRTANKTTDDINDTLSTNVPTSTEAVKPQDEAAKTNVSDPDLLNRFGLSDKEYLLVPIGTVSQNTMTVATPTQLGSYQILQQNLGNQQPAGLIYSNLQNVLSYPRSNQASAVHFPNENQVQTLPQNNNLNYNPGYHTNHNTNQNLLAQQPQVNVNNNQNGNYGASPEYVQQNLNTNLNNNYPTNPGYVNNVAYASPQSQGSVHFPNNGQGNYVPGYANVNSNLNNNFVSQQPSLNNNGVQYTILTQGYQPNSNQNYGMQSPNTQLQNPSNQQLLIVPTNYQNAAPSGYQTLPATQNIPSGNQLYLLAPTRNYLLLSVPGGSTVQGYMVVPRNT